MDARPHLFPSQLVLLAVAEKDLAPAVGHHEAHAEEVVSGTETTGRDVALFNFPRREGEGSQSTSTMGPDQRRADGAV